MCKKETCVFHCGVGFFLLSWWVRDHINVLHDVKGVEGQAHVHVIIITITLGKMLYYAYLSLIATI